MADIDGKALRRWLQKASCPASELLGCELEHESSGILGRIVESEVSALTILDPQGRRHRVPVVSLDHWVLGNAPAALAEQVSEVSPGLPSEQEARLRAAGFNPAAMLPHQTEAVLRALQTPRAVSPKDVETICVIMQATSNARPAFDLLDKVMKGSAPAASYAARIARASMPDLNPILADLVERQRSEAYRARWKRYLRFDGLRSPEERIVVAERILERVEDADDLLQLEASVVLEVFSGLDSDVPQDQEVIARARPLYDRLVGKIVAQSLDLGCELMWLGKQQKQESPS